MKLSDFTSTVVPHRCPVCRKIPDSGNRICGVCSEQLIKEEKPICRKCGRYIFNCKCKSCVTPVYKSVIAPYTYVKGAKEAIVNLKFHGVGDAAYVLAEAMSAEVKQQYKDIQFDLIIPVPLHPLSEFRRGYNQSVLLAAKISDDLGVTLEKKALKKIRMTASQHELGGEERRKNLQDAFSCVKDLSGKTVLLADDIITTGATLSECSKELLKAGAAAVYAVVAAVV